MTRLRVGLLAAWLLAAALPAAAETISEGVFDAGLMRKVQEPSRLRYRYEISGITLAQPFTSPVTMEVREVRGDGEKSVFFDMFEGPNRRQFGPMAVREQNPLIIVFLQRDVSQMANLTGGAANYFQQQIRKAFAEPAQSAAVEVELAGRKLAATKLTIRPFRDDPNIARFPQFRDKAYEFIVAKEVPGGLYRIASRTPDIKDGRIILEESMTFQEISR